MTKETIQKCIDLLNTDGINSKEQVKKILQGELETIENANPSEALECLENLCDEFPILKKDYKIIKQALIQKSKKEQAWDIVKKKGIDIGWLTQCETVKVYNYHCDAELLTEEEFNLLKEVLK